MVCHMHLVTPTPTSFRKIIPEPCYSDLGHQHMICTTFTPILLQQNIYSMCTIWTKVSPHFPKLLSQTRKHIYIFNLKLFGVDFLFDDDHTSLYDVILLYIIRQVMLTCLKRFPCKGSGTKALTFTSQVRKQNLLS